ncbi:hypothetical protein Slin15195_G022810 [Septoria linicola]|uniref:Uncharacterized protein n=1 Tax=Septoria linicola TaxID=215465 RepID=A0A9Q9EGL9_9PEZI|nr:hypothetical protein Slin15195_G022810 [Septoria linicola]
MSERKAVKKNNERRLAIRPAPSVSLQMSNSSEDASNSVTTDHAKEDSVVPDILGLVDRTRYHIEAGAPATVAEKPFPFSDLTPELRCRVYEKHLEDVEVHISLQRGASLFSTPHLTVDSPFMLVNKNFGKAFHDLATSTAMISTKVVDFDFSHITEFLDHPHNAPVLQRLNSGAQTLVIELSLTGTGDNPTRLSSWLEHAGDPPSPDT